MTTSERGLISLDEWNRQPSRRIPQGNGIACPKCGHELQDTGVVFLCSPSLAEVKCPFCDFVGNRRT